MKKTGRSILLLLFILLIPVFYVVYLEPEFYPGFPEVNAPNVLEVSADARTQPALTAPQADAVTSETARRNWDNGLTGSGIAVGDGNAEENSRENLDPSRRTPPDPASLQLSDRVYRVIEEVQVRQRDDQWEESLNEMNALYAEFDTLNPLEQATLLNHYTNILIELGMWQESISAFSLMLTVEGLRPDLNARALQALGQLHKRVGEPAAAIGYFEEWLRMSQGDPAMETRAERIQQEIDSIRATL